VIPAPTPTPLKPDGSPDFKKMSAAQKVAYSRSRIVADFTKSNNHSK
jgi:hypothetical protein